MIHLDGQVCRPKIYGFGWNKKKETTSMFHCKCFEGHISWLMNNKLFSYVF